MSNRKVTWIGQVPCTTFYRMIVGMAKASGSAAITATRSSGFDPEFPHGTVFNCTEVHVGLVEFLDADGIAHQYNSGKDITYLTTSLSKRDPTTQKVDHVIPLSRFTRRNTVRVANLARTEAERQKAIQMGFSASEIAQIEIFDDVSAPWFPGQGLFQVIRRDSTAQFAALCQNPDDYTKGDLRDNWEKRLATFLVGKELVSDHHVRRAADWIVFNRYAAKNRQLSTYTNGLQFFRLSQTREDLVKTNPLWKDLFEAGDKFESENNTAFIAKYGGF